MTDEQYAMLDDSADAARLNKQQSDLCPTTEQTGQINEDPEVRRLAREAVTKYGSLLDRLAQ